MQKIRDNGIDPTGTAIIGDSRLEVSISVYEFNLSTKVLTLVHPDNSKTFLDTNKDRVSIKFNDVIVDEFSPAKV